MNELHQWEKPYAALKDFITAHSGIAISKSEISIPRSLRDEFYRYFDDIRTSIVEECLPSLPVDVGKLSENYIEIENEVMAILDLESISMPMDLYAFLQDPEKGLSRVLYNTLFDLLQDKISPEDFIRQSVEDIRVSAIDLFRLGYEFWSALVLIKNFDPDEAFQVDLDDDLKPCLRELKSIAFGRQVHHPTMRVPEFVLHSRRINTYVAFKMPLVREIESYIVKYKPMVRPRKRTGDTSFALDSRVIFLAFMASPQKIPIFADIYECTLTSPDWVVEYINRNELDDQKAMARVEQHLTDFDPHRGFTLIVLEQDSEPPTIPVPEKIDIVAAGFDTSGILAMVDKMKA
jgi:hypothetical protein